MKRNPHEPPLILHMLLMWELRHYLVVLGVLILGCGVVLILAQMWWASMLCVGPSASADFGRSYYDARR